MSQTPLDPGFTFIDVIYWIRNICYNVLKIIYTFLRDVKRNILLFIFCVVLVSCVSLYYRYAQPDTYTASFTISYREMVRLVYGNQLYKLNELVQRKDYKRVGQFLGMSEADASDLISLNAKNVLGVNLEKDLDNDRGPFVVTMVVKKASSIYMLQYGILHFLETNPLTVERRKVRMKEIDDELAFIDRQLAMMDSLKIAFNKHLPTEINEKSDNSISSVYKFSYDLYKKREVLIKEKLIPDNLQVADSVISPQNRKISNQLLAIISVAAILILYSFLVYLIIPAWKKVKESGENKMTAVN
ncbi:MAG TPA: hypothetical protein VN721_17280 [Flavipsychrobacter sp.]|nr:hypothetical protein [Flavipsychrobacter sp.]